MVSGLARGVDTAANIGALGGSTVGVIASGIDIAFPPENEALQEKIANDQLLIAEQPPSSEPLVRHFPSRNRIIAGLAHGTVVIEAAPRSGSLIAARSAGDYGREVMAVPGSPLDPRVAPRAQGCNLLIRESATLIQTVDDLLEAVGPIDTRMVREPVRDYAAVPIGNGAGDGDRRRVIDLLGPTPVAVDELVRQSGQATATVQLVLLELELAGRIERHAGAKISLVCGRTQRPNPRQSNLSSRFSHGSAVELQFDDIVLHLGEWDDAKPVNDKRDYGCGAGVRARADAFCNGAGQIDCWSRFLPHCRPPATPRRRGSATTTAIERKRQNRRWAEARSRRRHGSGADAATSTASSASASSAIIDHGALCLCRRKQRGGSGGYWLAHFLIAIRIAKVGDGDRRIGSGAVGRTASAGVV